MAGQRKLVIVHEVLADAGLFVMLRIGPYVCAEYDNGGLPSVRACEPNNFFACFSHPLRLLSPSISPLAVAWVCSWLAFPRVQPAVVGCLAVLVPHGSVAVAPAFRCQRRPRVGAGSKTNLTGPVKITSSGAATWRTRSCCVHFHPGAFLR
jgi:hypothetical protein